VGFTLATAAAAGLHAPTGAWIATLALGALCVLAAGLQHRREGRVSGGTPDGIVGAKAADVHAHQIRMDTLSRRRTLGQHMFAPIDRFDESSDDIDAFFAVNRQVHEWAAGVRDTLTNESWELVSLFDSDVGMPDKYDPVSDDGSIQTYAGNLRRELSRRLLRLDQIIERLGRGH
jgi:hypothetical protein